MAPALKRDIRNRISVQLKMVEKHIFKFKKIKKKQEKDLQQNREWQSYPAWATEMESENSLQKRLGFSVQSLLRIFDE